MSSESRPMEVIKHNLDCKCHRRREWIRVNDKWHAIEFSVDDPNDPPMTEAEKANVALIIQQHLSKNPNNKILYKDALKSLDVPTEFDHLNTTI